MNRKNSPTLFLGFVPLITVIIVVIFVSFASLCFVSANNEAKLTDKMCAFVSEYYEAENKAEEKIAVIMEKVSKGEVASLKKEGVAYTNLASGIKASFEIPINSKKNLVVEIKITKKTSGWKVRRDVFRSVAIEE